jgi:hypothetical protein
MATAQDKKSESLALDSSDGIEASQNIPNEQDCVSPKDFVRLSGLSLSTVRRYLKDGRLPKFQFGGDRCRVLIPRDALTQVRSNGIKNEDGTQAEPLSVPSSIPPEHAPKRSGPKPRWQGRD